MGDLYGAALMGLIALALLCWGLCMEFGKKAAVHTPEPMGPDPDAEWRAIERVTGMDVWL